MTVRFVTVDELVHINAQMPTTGAIHTILKGKDRVRDSDLLEKAALRPRTSAGGADAFPTLEDKAAALLHSVARYHPFADGNKRTATIGAIFMLAINGRRVTWDDTIALERIIDVAEGRLDVDHLGAWITTEASEPALAPDTERDTAIIAQIMAERAWLLDQLAER